MVQSAKMYKQRFWMCHFGSPTMKRTILWSTSSAIGALSLYMKASRKKSNSDKKTAVKYKNKHGETAYKGSSFLKRTQCLGCKIRSKAKDFSIISFTTSLFLGHVI